MQEVKLKESSSNHFQRYFYTAFDYKQNFHMYVDHGGVTELIHFIYIKPFMHRMQLKVHHNKVIISADTTFN